jgi:hypothetical protein
MSIPKTSTHLKKDAMRSTKGLTLGQLMTSTTSDRKKNSANVDIENIKYIRTNGSHLVAKAAIGSARGTGEVYHAWFTFIDAHSKSEVDTSRKVHAQCTCYDYYYRWEYANAAHNAARIFCGNGESPIIQNPGLSPGLCKHLFSLAEHMLDELGDSNSTDAYVAAKIKELRDTAARVRESAEHADRNSDRSAGLNGAYRLESQADDLEKNGTNCETWLNILRANERESKTELYRDTAASLRKQFDQVKIGNCKFQVRSENYEIIIDFFLAFSNVSGADVFKQHKTDIAKSNVIFAKIMADTKKDFVANFVPCTRESLTSMTTMNPRQYLWSKLTLTLKTSV